MKSPKYVSLFLLVSMLWCCADVYGFGVPLNMLNQEPGKGVVESLTQTNGPKAPTKLEKGSEIDLASLYQKENYYLRHWLAGYKRSDGEPVMSTEEALMKFRELILPQLNEEQKARFEELEVLLKAIGDKEPVMTSALIKFFVVSITDQKNKAVQSQAKEYFRLVKAFVEKQEQIKRLVVEGKSYSYSKACEVMMEQVQNLGKLSDVLAKTAIQNTTYLDGTKLADYQDPSDPLVALEKRTKLLDACSRSILDYSIENADVMYKTIRARYQKAAGLGGCAIKQEYKNNLKKHSDKFKRCFTLTKNYIRDSRTMLKQDGTYSRSKKGAVVFTSMRTEKNDRGRKNAELIQSKLKRTFELLSDLESEVSDTETQIAVESNKKDTFFGIW